VSRPEADGSINLLAANIQKETYGKTSYTDRRACFARRIAEILGDGYGGDVAGNGIARLLARQRGQVSG
jgi:hypothetical protein